MSHRCPTEKLSASNDPKDKAILRERRRVLRLLEAHRLAIDEAYLRLVNLIDGGEDTAAESDSPEDERLSGFEWREE